MLPILQLGEQSILNGVMALDVVKNWGTACPIPLLKYPLLALVQSVELSIKAVVLLNMDELLPNMNWRILIRPPLCLLLLWLLRFLLQFFFMSLHKSLFSFFYFFVSFVSCCIPDSSCFAAGIYFPILLLPHSLVMLMSYCQSQY